MDKTIAKNRTKLISAIVADAHYITTWNLQKGRMVPLDSVDFIPKDLLMYRNSRLTMDENGLCRFSIHSNDYSHFKVSDKIVKQVFK